MSSYEMAAPRRRTLAWLLIRRSVWAFFAHDCVHLAASVAYYELLSVFPLLLGIIAVFGSLLGPDEIERRLVEVLALTLPTTPERIAASVRHLGTPPGALGFFAIAGLILSGFAVFSAIRIAIERAWGVDESRPYWRQKLLELTMMVVVVALMLVSMSFTAAIHLAEEAALLTNGPTPLGAPTTQVLLSAFAFIANLAIFNLIYRYVPGVPGHGATLCPGRWSPPSSSRWPRTFSRGISPTLALTASSTARWPC